jgi:hypothetical protein
VLGRQPDLGDLAPLESCLVDDDVVHHLPAERPRVPHPRPSSGEAVQRLLVDVFAQARIGREESRQAQQGVAGLSDEHLEGTFLLSVHLAS